MLSPKEHEQKTAALMDGAVRSVALYGLENASTKTISACCGINEAYITVILKARKICWQKRSSVRTSCFLT